MRFLADQGLEFPVVLRMRAPGHDVLWIQEESPGIHDEADLSIAGRQRRILVTNDLDFGALVYRDRRASAGVILLRMEGRSPAKADAIERLLEGYASRLRWTFTVVGEDRIRFRPLPGS